MRVAHVLAASFCLTSVFGCGIPQRDVRVLEFQDGKSMVVTFPADLRGAYLFKPGTDLRICAEPGPDVALESLQRVTANLQGILPTGQSIGGTVTSDTASEVIQLAGRTQLVVLAREMLFRACELSLNHNLKSEAVLELYNSVGKLVKDLGQTEKTNAETNLSKAENEKMRTEAALKRAGGIADKILKEEKEQDKNRKDNAK